MTPHRCGVEFHGSGVWAVCVCGWESVTVSDRRTARQLAELHAATAAVLR